MATIETDSEDDENDHHNNAAEKTLQNDSKQSRTIQNNPKYSNNAPKTIQKLSETDPKINCLISCK